MKQLIILSILFLSSLVSFAQTTYYSNGNTSPNNTGNWWTSDDGTGANPGDFTNTDDLFIIQVGNTYTLSADWSLAGSIQIDGTLDLDGNTFSIGKNFDNNGTFTHSDGTVNFNGTDAQSISGTNTFYDLTITNTSGTGDKVDASSSTALTVTNLLHIDNGIFVSASDYEDVTIDVGETLELSGDITVSGNWTNNGTLTHNNHKVTFDGTAAQTISGSTSFYDLTVNNNNAAEKVSANGSTLAVTNILRIQDGIFESASDYEDVTIDASTTLELTGDITVSGDWTNNGTFTPGTNKVTFDGAAAQTLTSGGTGAGKAFYDLEIANTHGSPDDANDVDASALAVTNTLTLTDGQFQPATGSDFNNITFAAAGIFKPDASATITVSGSFDNSTDAGTFTHNSGIIEYDGAGQTVEDNVTYFTLKINSSGTATAGGNLDIDGILDITLGTLDMSVTNFTLDVEGNFVMNGGTFTPRTGNHNIAGNWDDNGGTFTATEGTITLSGTTKTIETGATNYFNNLIIDGEYSTSTVADVVVENTLTINNTKSLTVSPGDQLTLEDLTVTGTLTVDADAANNATLDFSTATNPVFNASGSLNLDGHDASHRAIIISDDGSRIDFAVNGTLTADYYSVSFPDADGFYVTGSNAHSLDYGTFDDPVASGVLLNLSSADNLPQNITNCQFDNTSGAATPDNVKSDATTDVVMFKTYSGDLAGSYADANSYEDDANNKIFWFNNEYFSNGNADPTDVNNWWEMPDGTGGHPADFTTGTDIFVIQNGDTYTNATGAWTVDGNIRIETGGTLVTGAFTNQIGGTSTIAGTLTIDNGGTFDAEGNFDATGGTINQDGTSLLKLGGATISSLGNLDAAAGTVEYYRADAQDVLTDNYYNITFSGSGNKTANEALNIDGNLTINAGPTLVGGAFTHTVNGNWTGTGDFTNTGTTINFDGTGNLSAEDFETMIVSAGTRTLTGGVTAVDLTVSAGTLAIADQTIQVTDQTDIDATLTISTGTFNGDGDFDATGATITFTDAGLLQLGSTITGFWTTLNESTGTVEYNRADIQNVKSDTYYNLLINGAGVKTAANNLDIDGDLTISAGELDMSVTNYTLDVEGNFVMNGGTFTPRTGNHNIAGNWDDNGGTYTAGEGTITLSGTTKTIETGAANYFNNLIIDGEYSTSTVANVVVENTLTINNTKSLTVSPGDQLTLEDLTVTGTLTVDADAANNATLDFSTATNPVFNASGSLNLDGHDASHRAIVKGADGSRIDFAVNGTLTADYYSVSFPDADGFYVTGANAHSINYGNFDYPVASGVLLNLSSASNLPQNITGCNFDNTGAVATPNNVKSDATTDVVMFKTYSGDLAGSYADANSYEDDANNKIFWFNNEYFSNGNADPTDVNNWWEMPDGTGGHPADFTTGTDIFVIQNGDTYTNATGAWTVSGSIRIETGGTLVTGAFTNQIAGTSTIAGTLTIDNGGTFDAEGNFDATGGTINQDGSSVLKIGSTVTSMGNLDDAAGTVEYYADVAQDIFTDDYFNLSFSGTGTKTALAGLNIDGNLTISAGTFIGGAFTHNVAGNWTGTGGFTNTGTTINFDGTGNLSAEDFETMIVSAGTRTLTGGVTAVDLTVSAGTLAIDDQTIQVTDQTDIDATLTISTGTLDFNGAYDGTGGTITFTGAGDAKFGGAFTTWGTLNESTGAVYFDAGVAQTIPSDTYYDLFIDGGAVKTAGGNLDIDGNLNIIAGTLDMDDANNRTIDLEGNITIAGTFLARAGNHNIAGNWDCSAGTFTSGTAGEGTITMSGAAKTMNIGAGSDFYNLTIDGTVSTSTANDLVVENTLSITAGNEFTLSNGDELKAEDITVTGTLSVGQNSTVNYITADSPTMDVAATGTLSLIGTSGNPATITSDDTHRVTYSMTDGGVFTGNHFAINYPDVNGLIVSGSGTHSIANGSFDYPDDNGCLLNISGASDISGDEIVNCSFGNSAGATTPNNVRSSAGTQPTMMRIFSGLLASDATTGEANDDDVAEKIFWFDNKYYSFGDNDAEDENQWWTLTNGTGSHPLNFEGGSDEFIVQAGHTYTANTGNWTVTNAVTVEGTLATSTNTIQVGGATTVTGTITIATGTFDANGTLDATGGNITFTGAGNLYLADAVTSLGILTELTGTITYDQAGAQNVLTETYNNLIIAGSGTKTATGGNLDVDGNLTISAGTLDMNDGTDRNLDLEGDLTITGTLLAQGGTHNFAGDFTNNGTFTKGTSTVIFDSGDAQTIKGTANTTDFNDFTKNTTALLTIGDAADAGNTVQVSGTFTWTDNNDQITVGNGQTVTFSIPNLSIAVGCTFASTTNGTTQIAGNFDNDGTFTHGNGSVIFTGTSGAFAITGANSTTFFNLTKNASHTLTIGDGVASGNTIAVANSFTWTDNDDNITVGNGQNVTFSIPSVTIPVGCTLESTANGTIQLSSNFVNNGTFTHGSGNVVFTGATAGFGISGSSSTTFNNFTKNTAELLTVGDAVAAGNTISVTGTFTWTDQNDQITVGNGQNVTFSVPSLTIANGCTFASTGNGTTQIAGNFDNDGTFTHGDGSVVFTGTSGAFAITGASSTTFYNLTKNATHALTIGDAVAGGNTIAVTNAFTWTDNDDNIDLGNGQAVSVNMPSVTVPAGCVLTATNDAALTTTSDITIAGTFTPGTNTHSIGGNWDCSAGTFTPGGGTITMTGAAKTINAGGGNNFNNLTIAGTISTSSSIDVRANTTVNATKTFTLSAGHTLNAEDIAVNGTFTLNATSNTTVDFSSATSATLDIAATGALNLNGTDAGNKAIITSDDGSRVTYSMTDGAVFTGNYFTINYPDAGGFIVTGGGAHSIANGAFDYPTNGGVLLDLSSSTNHTTEISGCSFGHTDVAGGINIKADATTKYTLIKSYSGALADDAADGEANDDDDPDNKVIWFNDVYYSHESEDRDASLLANWWPLPNHTGTNPTDWTANEFIVQSAVTYTATAGDWTITNNVTVEGELATAGNTIQVGGASDINGTLTIATGAFDANGAFDATGGNVTFTGAGNLYLADAVTSLGTLTELTGTITYDQAGAQDVLTETYNNLIIAGSGTKTITGGNLDVDGNLTISAGTIDMNDGTDRNLDLEGDLTITGTLLAQGGTHNIGGDFTNNGTFTKGTSTVIFDSGDAQAIKGSSATSFNNLTNSIAAAQTLTIGDNTTGGNTIDVSGTFTWTDNNNNLTVGTGQTVIFDVPTITVPAGCALVSTDDATLTIGGNMTVAGSFDPGVNTHTVAGNWDCSAGTFQATEGTIEMTGATKTINAGATNYFYNIDFSTGGTKTLLSAIDVNGELSISAGTFDVSTFDITVAGDWTNAATFTCNNQKVTFDGTGAQLITTGGDAVGKRFYDIDFTGASTKTLGGALYVLDDISIGATSTLDVATNNTTTLGDWTNSGSFISNNQIVTFGGTAAQVITTGGTAASQDFYNLILSGAGSKTLAGNIKVNNAMSLQASCGTFETDDANNYTVEVGTNFTMLGGTFNARAGSHTVGGNWSDAAGTFQSTSEGTVTLTGASKTIATGAGNSFYNLIIDGTISSSTANDIDVKNSFTVNASKTFTLVAGDQLTTKDVAVNGTLTVGENAIVDLQNYAAAPTFTVDAAGTLNLTGTSGNNAQIISDSDSRIDFTINGIFAGNYFSIQYPDIDGFYLTGAALKTIENGAFDYPILNGCLLNLSSATDIENDEITGCTFDNAGTVGTAYNIKANATTQLTLVRDFISDLATDADNGELNDVDANDKIIWFDNNYYSSGNNNADVEGNWWSLTNGTGTNPDNFNDGALTFVVQNGDTYTANADWNVAGKVNIETGGTLTTSSNTITMAGTTTIDGTLDIGTGIYDANEDIDAGGGTINFSGTGTLKIGSTVSVGWTTLTEGSGTIEYDENGAQSIISDTYNNLVLSTGGNKTAAGALDIDGNFTINAGPTFIGDALTHTVEGNWIGTGDFTNAGTTINFDGTGSINSEVFETLQISAGTRSLTGGISCGALNVTGGTFEVGNQTVTTTGTVDIDGTVTIDNTGELTTSASSDIDGTLTINTGGTYDADGDFDATNGTINQDGTSILELGGATTTSLGALDAAAGTVTYNRAGAQNVVADNYYHVIFDGAGNKTAGGILNVDGNLTISAGTFVGGASTHTVAGNWVGTGGFDHSGGTTIEFDGTGSVNAEDFGALVNSSGTRSVGGALTATSLDISGGTFGVDAASIAVSGATTINVGTLRISSGTADCNGDFNATGGSIDFTAAGRLELSGGTITSLGTLDIAAGTVVYDGANMDVLSDTYYNLETDGTNTKSLAGNVTLNGDLVMTASDLSIGANTLTINDAISVTGGTWTGGATSNIIMGGATAITSIPAINLNNLTINRANGIDMSGDIDVDGTLTLTSGTFTIGANTLTINNVIAGTATNLSGDNTSSINIEGAGAGISIPSSVNSLANVVLNNTNGLLLQGNLSIDTKFTLIDGALDVNGNALSYAAGAELEYQGSAIQTTTDNEFPSANGPENLTINNSHNEAGTPATPYAVYLHENRTVPGTLTLTDGKLDVYHQVTLTAGVTSGGSATSYVQTRCTPSDPQWGGLQINVAAADGAVDFPVGSDVSYTPVTITNTAGGASDIKVRVFDNSYAHGTGGWQLSDQESVDKTWEISPSGSPTLTFKFFWNLGDEDHDGGDADFDRAVSRVGKVKGNWNDWYWWWWITGEQAATNEGGGVYSRTVTGVTDFSKFGVGSGDSELPVELINFTGTQNNSQIDLSWSTASETGNDYFEIQKSSNGIDFNTIDIVQGAGNSSETNNYHSFDYNPKNGINYYRLKQVDFSGEFVYSDIISINFNKDNVDENEIEINAVYNNRGKAYIDLSSIPSSPISIQLTSINGKVIDVIDINELNSTLISFDLSNYARGAYIIKIILNKDTTLSKKLIY